FRKCAHDSLGSLGIPVGYGVKLGRQIPQQRTSFLIKKARSLLIRRQWPFRDQETGTVKQLQKRLCAFLEAGEGGPKLSLFSLIETSKEFRSSLQVRQGGQKNVEQRAVVHLAHVNSVECFKLLKIEAGGPLVD